MVYVVMGVSGCGKSTVGRLLADRLCLPFYDGDDFHPAANVGRMKSGRPLMDKDRMPWLRTLAGHIQEWNRDGGAVLACSALKQAYRDLLSGGRQGCVRFIWLDGSAGSLAARVRGRTGHFMPPGLLESQFQTLEAPSDALRIALDALDEPVSERAVEEIVRQLGYV